MCSQGTVLVLTRQRDKAQARHVQEQTPAEGDGRMLSSPGGATSEMDTTHGGGGKKISPSAGVKQHLQDLGRASREFLELLSSSNAQTLAWEHITHMKNSAGIAFRTKTFLLKSD